MTFLRELLRKAATTALKDARAFDPLVSLLCDPDPNLRLNAISGLRILGDMRVLDPLIAALNDPDEHVRLSAVLALGELGDTRALVPLRTLLVDPSVAKEARHALALLGASA